MNIRTIISAICLSALLFAIGCASGITMVAPPVEEVSYGEKGVGERINVVYMLEKEGKVYTLSRQPYCKETVEEIRTSRKRPRGLILALCELPLYGLGMMDYLVAKVYANSSAEELGRTIVHSGRILPCGEVERAPGKEILLQFPDSERMEHLLTDDKARIHLAKLIEEKSRDLQINLFVKDENNILYIKTIDRTYDF